MSEHTPGPWGWLPSDNGVERWVLQGWCGAKGQFHEGLNHSLNECGVFILSCECPSTDTPYNGDYRPNKADAQLIAAAPELLAACKAVDHIADQLPNTLADVRPLLEAAIAKATKDD